MHNELTGVFPAYAGVIPSIFLSSRASRSVPRVCGVDYNPVVHSATGFYFVFLSVK